MDKPYFREQLLKHKSFFQKLHQQTQVTKTLNHASDEALNFLLKFLYLIVNGHVSLKHDGVEAISKSLRETKLAEFESQKFLLHKLKSSREDKLKTLRQFRSLYGHLLHYVFNAKEA